MSESCFAILLSLRDPTAIATHGDSEPKVLLQLLISIVLHQDLPFYHFMNKGCGVDVTAICRDILYSSVQSSAMQINFSEFSVIVRIFCAAAAAAVAPEQVVVEQLIIAISLFAAGVVKELAATIRDDNNKMRQQQERATAAVAETPRFIVSPAFIARVQHFIDSHSHSHHGNDGELAEIILSKLLQAKAALSREAQNMWKYALASRREFGGMDSEQRAELVAAALEMSGDEIFPHMASVHAAARACLALISESTDF